MIFKSLFLFLYIIVVVVTPISTQDVQRIAIQGQTATLPCNIDISGDVNVQWLDPKNIPISYNLEVTNGRLDRYKIDSRYKNDRNLIVYGVHSDDAGTYQCRLTKSGSSPVVRPVILIVNVPPTILSSSRDRSAETGTDVQLECFAAGTPQPNVTWFQYVGEDRVSLGMEGNMYVIPNVVRQTSAGIYECFVDNGVKPPVFAKMRVDVLFGPIINVPYREVTQREGATTMLSCIITANPIGSFYWQRDGRRLENDGRYLISNWSLGEYQQMLGVTLTDLVAADYGIYECVAENVYGQDTGRMTVHEFHASGVRVLTTPKDAIVAVGSRTVLDCSVVGMAATDSLVWWYTNDQIRQQIFVTFGEVTESTPAPDSDKYEIVGQYNLVIKSASFDDAGTYICDITGRKNYSVELSVLEQVSCKDEVLIVDDGEKVNAECTFAYAGPRDAGWRVHWARKDTGERQPSTNLDYSDHARRVLMLTAKYTESDGEYICNVSSRRPIYTDSCTTRLRVLSNKGNTSASCSERHLMPSKSDSSSTVLFLSLLLTVVVIAFVLLLSGVVTHYRRRLAVLQLEQPESVPLKAKSNGMPPSPVNV